MAFLRNSWYCGGWSSDLIDKPVGIRLLDEEIVLFRTEAGEAVALSGICPHRFAPLARGRVCGSRIECGYHGLQYDRDGTCVLNPHGRQIIPPRARLSAYPLVEQDGVLWVWMGDPSKADPKAIPSFDFLDSAHWTGITGHFRVNANYQLVTDNLLDLTHALYLHEQTVGPPDRYSGGEMTMEHECKTEGTTVHSNYIFRNTAPTNLFVPFFGTGIGDLYAFAAWYPASSLLIDVSMSQPGESRESGIHLPNAHFIVPETEDTCHYFYAISRNVERADEAKTRAMGEMLLYAFTEEDEPMIRDCHRMMGGKEFFSLEPAILETDVAGIQARRILNKLIAREKNPLTPMAEEPTAV